MKKYYISYSDHPKDEGWAVWVEWLLHEKFGHETLMRKYDLEYGDNKKSFIDNALRWADVAVIILTNEYMNSESCKEEFSNSKKKLPIVFDSCKRDGSFSSLYCLDLSGLESSNAEKEILYAISGNHRPSKEPLLPRNNNSIVTVDDVIKSSGIEPLILENHKNEVMQLQEISVKRNVTLVVTALEKELKPLIDMIAFPLTFKIISIDDIELYYLDISIRNTLIATTFKGMGAVTAALSILKIIDEVEVNTVILTGICGGLNRSILDFGDIIISDQIVNYDIAKITDKKEDIRWEVYRGNDQLRKRLLNSSLHRWRDYIKSSFPDIDKTLRVHSGTVLSGNKIYASENEVAKLLSHWEKALAVEMEAAGISAALHSHKHPPSFIMAKSVCDFADAKKNDDWQSFAATVAASFVIDYVFSLTD